MARKKTRIFSLLMTVALVLTLCMGASSTVFAMDAPEAGCKHEAGQHDDACGFVAPIEAAPCANAETDPACTHEGDCGFVAANPGQGCGHTQHDEECGGLAQQAADDAAAAAADEPAGAEGDPAVAADEPAGADAQAMMAMAAPPVSDKMLYYKAEDSTLYVLTRSSSTQYDTPAVQDVDYSGSYTGNGSTLTLDNFKFSTTNGYGLNVGSDITIELVGDNTLEIDSSGNSKGINTGMSITIKNKEGETGTLTVTSNAAGSSMGVNCKNLTLESGTVTVTAGSAAYYSTGVQPLGTLTMNGGQLNTTAGAAPGGSVGLAVPSLAVNGGIITAQTNETGEKAEAIMVYTAPTGTFTAKGGASSAEEFELVRSTSGATANMYVLKSDETTPASYAKIVFDPSVPNITGISASPASIAAGGTSAITVTGTNLPAGVTVTAFDGDIATDTTGTTDASGNVTLTFPANTTDNKVYTIKASLDGGATWATATATVQVEAAPKPAPTGGAPQTGDGSNAGLWLALVVLCGGVLGGGLLLSKNRKVCEGRTSR